MPRGRDTVNEGIQATNVTAKVMAVGRRARAEMIAIDSRGQAAIKDALAELRQALRVTVADPGAQRDIAADVDHLETLSRKPRVDPAAAQGVLTRIAEKLTKTGVVLSAAAALGEPIRKIAELLKIPLAGLLGG